MKKLFLFILSVSLLFGVVACGQVTTTQTDTTTTEAVTTTQTEESTTTTTTYTGPEFSGPTAISVEVGMDLSLDAITASDAEDGDLTGDIVVDYGTLDTDTIGEYTITLTVTDSDGFEAEYTVTVTVTPELTPTERAQLALDSISLDYVDGQTLLTFPKFYPNGTWLYWKSSDTHVITGSGYVIKPHVGSDPVEVTLTCTAKNSGVILTKDFVLTIQPNPEATVTSKVQLPYEGTSTEYVTEDQTAVDVFFVDNGTVPYMDVQTFTEMIDGALDTSIITFTPEGDDGLWIEYSVEYLDFDEVTVITEEYWAYIDFTENTFTVNNFDFFESYIGSTESDYGSGLVYTGADYVDGNEVTIPLGDYNFDILIYEDGGETYYLMPLHVINLLIAGGVYFDVYYNGDTLYGVDTFVMNSSEAADVALLDTIRTSSYNDLAMQNDMKLATYNFLALAFDYFYGLKEDRGIETYYTVLDVKLQGYMDDNDKELYNALFDFANARDDLHTWHQFTGYYEAPFEIGLSISDLGPRTTAFYEGLWAVQDLLDAKYGSYDDMPEYELLDSDKIAVIHLTGFDIDTPDNFKAILDGLPTTVEDVVVDLSYNTGGNLGAVLRIYGYMTEEPFTYHSQNPADGSAVTYYIESDYVAYDYNWYVQTSSVTFSAANLFTSMAKELGIPVIGQNSSGGASSIGVIILPEGTAFFISTNNVLSTRSGDEVSGYVYSSIENGIDVDYRMNNVTSDTELVSIIHTIKAAS
ncbi:MAG: DUF5011 domain-containing protein [Bacilli bacterium]|nr:DUF5011 domain-containing protein [Bacilli bacterium]MBN2877440.1 DUF5011 domain-containing protein [Bacilli bacterium]